MINNSTHHCTINHSNIHIYLRPSLALLCERHCEAVSWSLFSPPPPRTPTSPLSYLRGSASSPHGLKILTNDETDIHIRSVSVQVLSRWQDMHTYQTDLTYLTFSISLLRSAVMLRKTVWESWLLYHQLSDSQVAEPFNTLNVNLVFKDFVWSETPTSPAA